MKHPGQGWSEPFLLRLRSPRARGGTLTLLSRLPRGAGDSRLRDQMARTVRRQQRCRTSAPRGTSRRLVQLLAGAKCPARLARRGWCPALGCRAPLALEVRLSGREAKGTVAATASSASSLHPETLRRSAPLYEAGGLTPKFRPPPEGRLPGELDCLGGQGHRAEMPASSGQERCLPSPGKTAPGKAMKRDSV